MTNQERLEDFLDAWLNDRQHGRERPVSELCRDCPELVSEVERRIAVLSHFEQLADVEPRDTLSAYAGLDTAVVGGAQHETDLEAQRALLGPLGGFVPRSLLGEGGMGAVYLAEDTKLHRQVALKVMKPELAASPAARQRFLREGRAMAAVEHDHIMTIYAVGEEHETPFLVMPVLKGETLESRLQREKRLPIPEACRIAREISAGLAAAHDVGLVHRDIKPSNIWLEGARGKVKILDFGLARVAQDQDITQSWAVLGTPAYMSPEQAAGAPATPHSDLFSLGCVLYRMTTGTQPFAGDTLMATLSNLANRQPEPPVALNTAIPSELSLLICSLLAKVPAQRPESAAAVADALESVEGRLQARAAAARRMSEPPTRRRTWLWGGLAGAAALLAAVIIITIEHDDGSKSTVTVTNAESVAVDAAPGSKVTVAEAGNADGAAPLTAEGADVSAAATTASVPTATWPVQQPIPVGESPLDALDPAQIPLEERADWQPPELVAVLGKHKLRHWGAIGEIAVSPAGDLIATASREDATVRLWNSTTGEELFLLQEPMFSSFNFLAFSPDGKTLAIHGAFSNVTLLYDVSQTPAHERARLSGSFVAGVHHGNPFSADGQSIVLNTPGTDVFQVWDLSTESPEMAVAYHLEPTTHPAVMQFLDDGQRMLLINWDESKNLLVFSIWELNDGTASELSRIRPDAAKAVVSPDGRRLAANTAQGTSIRLYRINAGGFEEQPALTNADSAAMFVESFSADSSSLIYLAGGRLLVRNLVNGEERPFADETGPTLVHQLAFSRDGRVLACLDSNSNGKGLQLYEQSAEGHWSLRMRDERSGGFFPSHDLTYLISGRPDMRRWSLGQPSPVSIAIPQVSQVSVPRAYDVFRDGRIVGPVHAPEWGVGIIDPARGSGAEPPLLPGGRYVNLLHTRISRDEKLLALTGYNCPLTLLEIEGSEFRVRASGELGTEVGLSLNISPDGQRLTSYIGDYGRLRLWDLRSPEPRLLKLWEGVSAHTFANDQPVLAVCMGDGKVRLFDVSSEEPRETLTLQPWSQGASSIVLFHGGKQALVADALGRMRFLDLPYGTVTREWKWPGPTELYLAYDGRHVIAINRNDTAYVLRFADISAPGTTPTAVGRSTSAAATAESTDEPTRTSEVEINHSHEREIAEWALSLGGTVDIVESSGRSTIGAGKSLPAGPFVVRGVRIQQTPQLDSEGLSGLLKLSDLQRLSLAENPQLGDDAAAIISSLPTLRSLDLMRASITDDAMTAIARLPRLESLSITATRVTDRGVANLAQVATLRSLWAESCPISIAGLRPLSQIPLKVLAVGSGHSQITMNDVQEIAELFPQLTFLDCRFKGSSPTGLSSLVALEDLTDIMITPDQLVAGEPHHLARFPALKRLRFWHAELKPEPTAQVRLIPHVDELFLQESRISEETLSILAESPNIRILSLYDWTGGDVELLKLAGMPALTRIDLRNSQVTAEGAARFHELRPDVTFSRDFPFTGQTK